MKTQLALCLLAASAIAAQSATILTFMPAGGSNGNGNYNGQSFSILDSGFAASGDALPAGDFLFDLDEVTFKKGNANNVTATAVYAQLYEFDGVSTFTYIDTSSVFDWAAVAQGSDGTFAFGTAGLSSANTYAVRFSNQVAEGGFITLRLSPHNQNDGQSLTSGTMLNLSGGQADAAFGDARMALQISNTRPIPEPSSTALLGLTGLGLLIRRRK